MASLFARGEGQWGKGDARGSKEPVRTPDVPPILSSPCTSPTRRASCTLLYSSSGDLARPPLLDVALVQVSADAGSPSGLEWVLDQGRKAPPAKRAHERSLGLESTARVCRPQGVSGGLRDSSPKHRWAAAPVLPAPGPEGLWWR